MSQHGYPERLSNSSKGFQEDVQSQQTMEVLVETLTGTAFEITVSPFDTVFDIKSKIYRVEGIPVSQQHLVYNLRELEDRLSLRDQSISDGAKLRLVLGLRGGPVATRRLPPPEPWHDIERLFAPKSGECEGSSSSGSGCKVTVVVFREGERVNMLRVKENKDGTFEHLDSNKYASSLSHLVECDSDDGGVRASGSGNTGASGSTSASGNSSRAVRENAVTMAKMLQLRRRMHSLTTRPHEPHYKGKRDIQKTRSEEILSVPSLLDDVADYRYTFEGKYTRFHCANTLLPPIGTRTDSAPLIQDDRLKLSDALSGSILVKREGAAPELDTTLTALHAADYGPVAVGESGEGWRGLGGGSLASGLAERVRHSAAVFSSSTSDLERLNRNRILPALSRYRNREHLHLSDEGLDMSAARPPLNLDMATSSRPAARPPLNLEVGSERRQRRIDKITELENRILKPEHGQRKLEPESGAQPKVADQNLDGSAAENKNEKKGRMRCSWCKRRVTIASVHVCRCGARYCAAHRYAEVHGCAFDYKASATTHAPATTTTNLPKI